MNNQQRKILIYVGVAIAVLLLYPPYLYQGGNGATSGAGYSFLFDPPFRAVVDVKTLLMEWLAVCLVGGIALALTRR